MQTRKAILLARITVIALSLWLIAARSHPIHALPATNVSGLIAANTTWTPAGNPYILTGNVTVAAGVTLTIQPGVVVKDGSTPDQRPYGLFIVGKLQAVGTAAKPIIFDQIDVGSAHQDNILYEIVVEHAQFQGGRFLASDSPGTGSFVLRDSILANIQDRENVPDNNNIQANFPVADSYIEGNIFYNGFGVNADTRYGIKVYVRNNVFVGWKGSYAVQNWGADDTSGTVVEQNSFLSTDRVAVALKFGAVLTATNNYWGTTNPTLIAQMIHDKNDSAATPGVILFKPFLMEAPADLLPWVTVDSASYTWKVVAGQGDTPTQPLTVISSVPWSATPTEPWIGLTQTTGSGLQIIGVYIKPGTLAAGAHSGKVTFHAGSASVEFTVHVIAQAAAAPTDINGAISSSTVWSAAGSPYRLNGTVVISTGVTLAIEPGVVIAGNGVKLNVLGALRAIGTSESPVIFDDVDIEGAQEDRNSPSSIDIQHAKITHGALRNANYANYGTLQLRDSTINELGYGIYYIYLWYPVSDVHIERNIFVKSQGIQVGVIHGVHVYIRNNIFDRQRANFFDHEHTGYAVDVWASYDTARVIVEHNSFLSTDRSAVRLENGDGDALLSARNNYWNTTDIATIKNMIFDQNDDPTAADRIPFKPFLTGPHPDTPNIDGMPPDDAGALNAVSGLLVTNTTWTKAKSPYVLTGDVQVSNGVTLTIEPGVKVEGDWFAIEVFGVLHAVGTAEAPILFDRLDIDGGATDTDQSYFIGVEHAHFLEARFLPSSGNGSFVLRDSILANTKKKIYVPDLNSIQVSYPVTDSYIERNIFYNGFGINAATSKNVKVYVRNNLFVGWKGSYAVQNSEALDTSGMVVEQNSFLSTDRVAVALDDGDSAVLTATNNYWGTTNPTLIAQMIHDKNDSADAPGVIPFQPFLTAASVNTPAVPDPILPVDPDDLDDPDSPTFPDDPEDPGNPEQSSTIFIPMAQN